ncbi:hypothetical protein EH223_00380 [candidate division KSB1 bacterium]|nr:hypothetical protein [candidate division KSB1 bacterium]RQW07108.1 MAG: hypothetical protein EH223_00380 [candidate division KSB1 bacterium]
MPNIQIDLIGENAAEALEKVHQLVQKYLGPDVAVAGATTAESTLKTLTAITLVLAIPTMLAHPDGFFQQLKNEQKQEVFVQFLSDLAKQYHIALTLTTPDGRQFNFNSMRPEELRDMLTAL